MPPSFNAARSLQGIKHRAKVLSKSGEAAYMHLLDVESKRAGFSSWKAAQRFLPTKVFATRISSPWDQSSADGFRSLGVETLTFSFRRPVRCMIEDAPATMLYGWFSAVEDGEAKYLGNPFDQADAREKICHFVRSLMFQEATGLIPDFGGTGVWPRGTDGNLSWDITPPGKGRLKYWVHPQTNEKLVTIERDWIDHFFNDEEMKAWCLKHDYLMTTLKWSGITSQKDALDFSLLTRRKSEIDLQSLVAAIELLPDDFSPSNWPGTSEISRTAIKPNARPLGDTHA